MYLIDVLVEYNKLDEVFTYKSDQLLNCYSRVRISFNHREIIGFIVNVRPFEEVEFTLLPILEVIDDKPILDEELVALGKWLSEYYCVSEITAYQQILPKKLVPRKNQAKPLKVEYVRVKTFHYTTDRQREVLEYVKQHQPLKRTEFNRMFKTIAKTLIKSKAIEVYTLEKVSEPLTSSKQIIINHTKDQLNAIKRINQLKNNECALLHGVTASGKSEVFYAVIEEKIKQGKQVLLLVPEIALVSQMIRGLKQRFSSQIALYHSGLSDQEKYEQYQLARNEKVNLIVGTRSSVFLPFKNLGLIIVDEEHDMSYKQQTAIMYDTIEVCQKRCAYHQCPLLLASATPRLETYAKAVKNIYQLIELKHKIYQNERHIQLVDMNDKHYRYDYLLSSLLIQKMNETLQKGEQVVLILNRRGYSNYIKCLECGNIEQCVNCDLALKYHQETNVLKCHNCGYEKQAIQYCNQCGSRYLSHYGSGTQKLEEYVKQQFPMCNVARLDKDSTTKKNALIETLESFEAGKYQILIGTQMIAKGLDFANVTLVGIINADDLLQRSSFQSVEQLFQLLVQSFGRSGRRKSGSIIVQVNDKNHYAIQSAIKENYIAFFNKEMKYRHLAHYTPYVFMASLILSHKNEQQCLKDALAFEQLLEGEYIGPIELYRSNTLYRIHYLVRSKDKVQLHQKLYSLYKEYQRLNLKSRLDIDFNNTLL